MTVVRLGDLVNRIQDRAPPDDERPCLGLEHVVPGQLRALHVAEASQHRSPSLITQPNDLLFAALRPDARKVLWVRERTRCSTEWLVLRPKPGVPAGFVFALFAHPGTSALAARLTSGASMPRIRWSCLADRTVVLPSTVVRARIHQVMDLFDRRLALAHRILEHHATVLSSLERAVHPGTEHTTFSDVCTPRPGRSLRGDARSAGSPVLGVADLPRHGFDIHTQGSESSKGDRRLIGEGDVLISTIRPELQKVGLCPIEGYASPEILALTPHHDWTGVLLARARCPLIQQRWTQGSYGASVPRTSTRAILESPLGWPLDGYTTQRAALAAVASNLLKGTRDATVLRDVREVALHRAVAPPS